MTFSIDEQSHGAIYETAIYNSTAYNSTAYNSTAYNSKVYNSTAYTPPVCNPVRSIKKWAMATGMVLALVGISVHAAELKPAAQAAPAPMTELVLPSVTGGSVALDDFKGQVILVDFWASWCGPCRQSFPWMNRLQSAYGDQGLKVVAINLDEDPAVAREFLSEVPAQFTVLLDSEAQLPGEYGVMGMPSSYLIDRNGKIRAQHIGFHSDRVTDYETTIKTLLAE